MPQTDLPPDALEKVTVRNNSRRSLMITVPGQAIHLQPGATVEVPRAFLTTDVLAALVRTGAVVPVVPAAAAVPPPARLGVDVEALAAAAPAPALADLDETAVPRPPRRTR
ncbi:MAG: hypothetical protein ABUS79_08915 [Pseudomonadota bacterium]